MISTVREAFDFYTADWNDGAEFIDTEFQDVRCHHAAGAVLICENAVKLVFNPVGDGKLSMLNAIRAYDLEKLDAYVLHPEHMFMAGVEYRHGVPCLFMLFRRE